ncbi:MAG: GNAT family N-acetyltransferase [Negativicutes bacterium]|nr:GNAT family N-acetyltransferase [Negativicutes bacterium]
MKDLMREYQASLGIDLCFQNFEQELAGLPGDYRPPDGRLYLAADDGKVAGCIALRRFDETTCEMKRLYVRPQFRGCGLARKLTEKIITDAREIGYCMMLLDTLPTMQVAQALYFSLGFREIPSYRFNPVPGTRYLCLNLL